MNLRQRYWMAGSLIVLLAMGAQRARGEEAWPLVPHDRLPEREAVRGLDDIVQEGPAAWLARGNQLQRAGRPSEALEAYLQATRAPAPADSISAVGMPVRALQSDARAKAWLNIALLHVAHASQAIDALDALPLGASLRQMRHDVARQVGAQRHRAYRAAEEGLGIEVPAAPNNRTVVHATGSEARVRSVADAGVSGSVEPYTVDRWIALPRRASTRPTAARSALVEPVSESPLPPMPTVERLQGQPSAPGR